MSWRFARTPKWIIRHLAVAALIVTMIMLGLWQLRRLDEKRAYKALVEARQEQPVVDVSGLLPADADVGDEAVEDVLYRHVSATGTYAADETVVVPNRTLNAVPGAWVLTPLELDDGTSVVVNRGFIGFDRQGEIVAPEPPSGPVSVDGLLFPSQERGRFGAEGPGEAAPHELARADLEQYEERVDHDLLPVYIQMDTSDPAEPAPEAGTAELVALGPPVLDEGPHMSYAVQWFTFTAIAAGGYALLLRKVAIDEAKASAAPDAGTTSGG